MGEVQCSVWGYPRYRGILCCEVCSISFDHLLTTSGPRGTFSRLSTTRGCISIIELLAKMRLREEILIIALGMTNFRGRGGGAASWSKLMERTLHSCHENMETLKNPI